jgi:hypothetical protein
VRIRETKEIKFKSGDIDVKVDRIDDEEANEANESITAEEERIEDEEWNKRMEVLRLEDVKSAQVFKNTRYTFQRSLYPPILIELLNESMKRDGRLPSDKHDDDDDDDDESYIMDENKVHALPFDACRYTNKMMYLVNWCLQHKITTQLQAKEFFLQLLRHIPDPHHDANMKKEIKITPPYTETTIEQHISKLWSDILRYDAKFDQLFNDITTHCTLQDIYVWYGEWVPSHKAWKELQDKYPTLVTEKLIPDNHYSRMKFLVRIQEFEMAKSLFLKYENNWCTWFPNCDMMQHRTSNSNGNFLVDAVRSCIPSWCLRKGPTGMHVNLHWKLFDSSLMIHPNDKSGGCTGITRRTGLMIRTTETKVSNNRTERERERERERDFTLITHINPLCYYVYYL